MAATALSHNGSPSRNGHPHSLPENYLALLQKTINTAVYT
jgi:hypothetical protein